MPRTHQRLSLLSLLIVTAPALAQWSSPINISNTTGRFSVDATLQIDGNNKVHIIYSDWVGGDRKVNYATNVTGAWTNTTIVNGASDPEFAITPDNVLHVFYKANSAIWEITKPAAGGSWSSPLQVNHNAPNGDKWPRHAAVDANGGLYFTYLHLWDDGATYPSAEWGRYKPLGGSWGSFEVVKPGPNRNTWPIDVQLFPNGTDMYCTYVMNGNAYYKKRNPAGGSWLSDVLISSGSGSGAPRLAFSPTGEWAVAYHRDNGGSTWFDVMVQFSTNAGASWGTAFNVSNSEVGLQRIPEITYDANGTFHIVYQRFTCDGCSQPEMFYRTRSTGGTWSSLVNLSNTSQRSGAYYQAIRAKGNDLHFVWHDANTSDGFEDVFYRSMTGSDPIPQFDSVALNATNVIADDTTQYTLTLKVSHGSGVNEIRDVRTMFNRDFVTTSNARGYLIWGQTASDVTHYGGSTTVIGTASGGGYWGWDNADWGYQYITPVSCSTSTAGTQRTITWTFKAKPAWVSAGPGSGNYIGFFARDNATTNGWFDSTSVFGYSFNVTSPPSPPGTISGTISSSLGGGLSGATVSTNTGGYSTTTNGSGQYTLSNVTPGTYTLTVTRSGYSTGTQPGVVVTSNNTTTVNMTLNAQPGAISGTVTSGGSPVAGATVSTNTGGYSTTTNGSGQYTLSNVTPGTYNVTASKSGYDNATVTGVTVNPGSTTSSVNLSMTAHPGAITGSVTTTGGAPIAGVTVATNVGGYSTTTNSNGEYTLSNVTPGTYNVTASASGYISDTMNGVVVNAGATTSGVSFALFETGSPTEYLVNGSMEGGWWNTGWGGSSVLPNGWDGWYNPGDFNCYQETSVKHGGSNSARTVLSSGGSPSTGGYKRGIVQFVELPPNAGFTITAWARHTNGNCPSIMAWNPGQNANPEDAFSAGRYKWITTDNWGQLNTWVSNTLTGTSDGTGVITIIIGGAHHGGGGNGVVYIDDVSCTVP